MPRVNRNLIYLAVAVLLGVAASLLAVRYVNKQVEERTTRAPEETRQVVVPVHDLKAGSLLGADDVAAREVPVDFVPADALTPDNYGRYIGQLLRAPLTQGAPIPASAVETVTDHFSNVITPGNVAYTIEVDEASSISGMIVPGDHIDVLMLTSGEDSDSVRPLLSDVLVLATGKHAKGVRDTGEAGNGSFSNITLQLSPTDAQRVGIARKIGQLLVMLRPAGSSEPFDLKTLSKADLLRMGRRVRGTGIEFIIGGSG
jgi:pilus assembly protein CpaB